MIDACDRCLAASYLSAATGTLVRDSESGADATTPAEILAASSRDGGLPPRLRAWSARDIRRDAAALGLAAVCRCAGDAYPQGLAQLVDPPHVLWMRGDPGALDACPDAAAGIVGTRRPTVVGRGAARDIAAGIARAGGTVVSGMALGIDAAAHDGALSVRGRTVAVLAAGVERATPVSHHRLYDRILERGAVVGELPPGTPPRRWTFPARNRLIAALSAGTLVVEAPLRSGALITVEAAAALGRDVWAVPGSLASEACEGSNRLLVDGAGAVVDAGWIVGQLALDSQGCGGRPSPAGGAGGAGGVVHAMLRRRPMGLAELEREASALDPGEIELALLDLELAGWARRGPDGRYRVA